MESKEFREESTVEFVSNKEGKERTLRTAMYNGQFVEMKVG